MNFSLHQLEIFVTVADAHSFSRAAERLLMTQPGVSMQIKTLERAVGLKLFDQVGRQTQLTEAGEELYGRAAQILGLARETAQSMTDLREGQRGRLRVVATTTVGIYVVPRLLGEYHRRHPEVDIRLEVANWERTCELLFRGEANVAIAGPHPQSGLVMEPFMDDELVVIAAPDHPLVGRARIPLIELAKYPMLMREVGSGTRASVETLFAERGVPLWRSLELSRNGAIKQVVRAGLGLAVLSRGSISLELAAGQLCLLEVEGFPIVRAWHLITRAGITRPPAVEIFCAELRESRGTVFS